MKQLELKTALWRCWIIFLDPIESQWHWANITKYAKMLGKYFSFRRLFLETRRLNFCLCYQFDIGKCCRNYFLLLLWCQRWIWVRANILPIFYLFTWFLETFGNCVTDIKICFISERSRVWRKFAWIYFCIMYDVLIWYSDWKLSQLTFSLASGFRICNVSLLRCVPEMFSICRLLSGTKMPKGMLVISAIESERSSVKFWKTDLTSNKFIWMFPLMLSVCSLGKWHI